MNKVVLGLRTIPTEEVVVFGKKITVKPYLSIQEQVKLIELYLNAYFFSEDEEKTIRRMSTDLIAAETSLIMGILEFCTDIDMDELSVNLIFETEFHLDILGKIKNYVSFKSRLDSIVESLEREVEIGKSVGGVLDSIFIKVVEALKRFEDIDAGDIEALSQKIVSLGKALEDSNISGLMDKK